MQTHKETQRGIHGYRHRYREICTDTETDPIGLEVHH